MAQYGQDRADTSYGRRSWNVWLDKNPGGKYRDTPGFPPFNPAVGPNPRNDERITGERILEQLENTAQPLQRRLFRPRFGYDQRALNIEDVLAIDDVFRQPNDTSVGGYSEINSGETLRYINTLGNV